MTAIRPIPRSPSSHSPISQFPSHPVTQPIEIFLLSILLFLPFGISGQTASLDSLRLQLAQHENKDRARVDLLNQIALEVRHIDGLESHDIYTTSLALAQEMSYPYGEARALLGLGFNHRFRSNLEKAHRFTSQAKEVFSSLQDTTNMIACYYNLAAMAAMQSRLVEAFNYNMECLQLAEDSDDKKWVVLSNTSLANVYVELYENEKATEYYQRAFDLATRENDIDGLEHCLPGMSILALRRGDYLEAIRLSTQGYQLAVKGRNINLQGRYLYRMATSRMELSQFDSCYALIQEIAKLPDQIGLDRNEIRVAFLLTKLYDRKGDLRRTIQHGESLLSMSEDSRFVNEIHPILAKAYARTGQYQEAFLSNEKYIANQDSLKNLESFQEVARIEFNAAMDQKQREISLLSENEKLVRERSLQQNRMLWMSMAGLILLSTALFFLWKGGQRRKRNNAILKDTLAHLKAAQTQLVHAEKMASLGELTAGIAHEIQNPLNFVNNFSDVSNEMIDEAMEELEKGDQEEARDILFDLKGNLAKIHHHGDRASSIVRGMLTHSRSGAGEKKLTDINALCDEYMRLSYHGMRAKNKSFNADLRLNLGENLPKINVDPQGIGRVMLNILNNAFYACAERSRSACAERSRSATHQKRSLASDSNFQPRVELSTTIVPAGFVPTGASVGGAESGGSEIQITITDNGSGMSPEIQEKLFQPFFTTKPTGEGTGLGMSISYDIVTKGHGGTISVVSSKGEGSTFVIRLPIG